MVAPLVSALVVLIMVGLGTLLWHRPVGADPQAGAALAATSSTRPGQPAPTSSTGRASNPATAADSGTSSGAPGSPATLPPPCVPMGVVDIIEPYAHDSVTLGVRVGDHLRDQLCPGERVRVFWATFRPEPGGVRRLFRTQSYWLDAEHPVVTMLLASPPGCSGAWFVGAGMATVPATYLVGTPPLGPDKLTWHDPVESPGSASPGSPCP